MHARTSLMVFAAALVMVSCGGGGAAPTPTTPTSTGGGGTTATTVTITIVGEKGALSFNPNPASVPAGAMGVWEKRGKNGPRGALPGGGGAGPEPRTTSHGGIIPLVS